MKIKLAAFALVLGATLCCSDSFGHDLLHKMLGRGGCGGCDAAPTCCDTPAPACGGRTLSINIHLPGRGLLAGLRNPGGSCGAPVSDCGCDAAPAASCGCNSAPVADCGCDSGCGATGGLLSGRFQGLRCGGCGLFKGGIGDGCGCDLMNSTPCASACDEVDACGCGLLKGNLFNGRLRGRVSGLFNRGACGCGAPVGSDCGCDAAPAPMVYAAPAPSCGCDSGCGSVPVANCGCDNAPACGCGSKLQIRSRVSGLLSRVGSIGCNTCGSTSACGCGADRHPVRTVAARVPRPLKNRSCGCGSPVADCGCGSPVADCGCGSRLSLLDRLRGNRVAAASCGCDANIGCGNSGCASGCGCDSSFHSNGAVNMMAPAFDNNPVQPYDASSVISAPVDAPPGAIQVQPAVPAAPAAEGDAIVPGDGASRLRLPSMNSNSFNIRNTGYRN